MKAYQFRKDYDGHNYLVPHEEVKQFDVLLDTVYYKVDHNDYLDAITAFDNAMGKYRIDGYTDIVFYLPQEV